MRCPLAFADATIFAGLEVGAALGWDVLGRSLAATVLALSADAGVRADAKARTSGGVRSLDLKVRPVVELSFVPVSVSVFDVVDWTPITKSHAFEGDAWTFHWDDAAVQPAAEGGTYFNFDLGHSFAIIDGKGEDDDPVLEFRPSVGQGFGNTQRVRGYSPEVKTYDHGGVMDTCIKGEFTWRVVDHVSLSAYVAYSDYWFDSTMRECAREHNAEWGHAYAHSWNFYGGVGVSVEF